MSTNAESATKWISEKKPTLNELTQVIAKLEERIHQWTGDDETIQGSIDALDVLQNHLVLVETARQAEPNPTVNLDTSNLIPLSDPIELDPDLKRKKFEALKRQLSTTGLKNKPH